ncbi:MAG TPA: RNA polymerase sigma factor [Gemmatimonadaceae bacterium]
MGVPEGITPQMSEEPVASDADLVRSVLDGEAGAFTLLVDRHAAACLRFAARMLGTREDAEDATQEALMRAYRALPTFDPRTSFRTWLFSILVNRCRTSLLRTSRRERRIRLESDAVERAYVESQANALELQVEISRALMTLPSELKEAFLLKHLEQLEYEQMAEVTGLGVSALKMRVRRACARLRRELEELHHAR